MNETEIINLLKDYYDYHNLDFVEVRVVGNLWHIEGYKNNDVVIRKDGKYDD